MQPPIQDMTVCRCGAEAPTLRLIAECWGVDDFGRWLCPRCLPPATAHCGCGAATMRPEEQAWGIDFSGRWICPSCRFPLLAAPAPPLAPASPADTPAEPRDPPRRRRGWRACLAWARRVWRLR